MDVTSHTVWIGFAIFICIALLLDTFVLKKKYKNPHESMRIALYWSLGWIVLALLFMGILWSYLYLNYSSALANEKALDFLTGYLIEKSGLIGFRLGGAMFARRQALSRSCRRPPRYWSTQPMTVISFANS